MIPFQVKVLHADDVTAAEAHRVRGIEAELRQVLQYCGIEQLQFHACEV